MQARSPLATFVLHLILIAGSALFLFPLVWMISTSVKPVSQADQDPPRLLPEREFIKTEDGREYPAAFYREKPGEDEKLVALVGRGAGTARIEMDGPATTKIQRTVPDNEVRTAPV